METANTGSIAIPGTEKLFTNSLIEGETYVSEHPMFGPDKVTVLDMTAESFPRLLQSARKATRHGWETFLAPDKTDNRAVLIRRMRNVPRVAS